MTTFKTGDRVVMMLPGIIHTRGEAGQVVEVNGVQGVLFDGDFAVTLAYERVSILEFCELESDAARVQLSFDWWLEFGDWEGERGEQDD